MSGCVCLCLFVYVIAVDFCAFLMLQMNCSFS